MQEFDLEESEAEELLSPPPSPPRSELARIGDLIYLTYNDNSFVIEVRKIRGRTLYLYDTFSKRDTSLTWSSEEREWSLPNGDRVPYSDVKIVARDFAPVLPEEAPNFRFTDSELTDLHLLAILPHDDFINACSTSRYSSKLCNGSSKNKLYRERIKLHYPDLYERITAPVKDWKRLYHRILDWKEIGDPGENGGYVPRNYLPRNIAEMQVFVMIFPSWREFNGVEEEIVWEAFERKNEESEDLILWYLKNKISDRFSRSNYLQIVYKRAYEKKYLRLIDYLETNKQISVDTEFIKYLFMSGSVELIKRLVKKIEKIESDEEETFELYNRTMSTRLVTLRIHLEDRIANLPYKKLFDAGNIDSLPTLKYLYELGIKPRLIDLYRAIENYDLEFTRWIIENIISTLSRDDIDRLVTYVRNKGDDPLFRMIIAEIDKQI
ncbi:MAG: hypothetical protein Solivirus2_48 [Solivirus sp.]|uniref:Uncharacterized protein n=1 Tax=Solivirus sp. TaxID=2487772 RepID=A0A3G5AFM3_9VIRU|nr:MAG: hypothetical protein Solivirus2_48 [Solivirus sp.]